MAENRALELNGGDDEDEALRIAIAMSLGQDPTQAEQERPGAIDLTGDESPPTRSASTLSPIPDVQPGRQDVRPPPPVSGPSSFSALGIDRKKMEEDRLARLKKRKAQELGETEASEQSQRQKRTHEGATSVPSPPPSIPSSRALPIVVREGVAPTPAPNAIAAKSNHRTSLPFPRGVVKKTWAYGQPRLGDDIKIEEVLQKDRLELAVLSSYQWDEDWLMSKIDIRRTRLVLVAFASSEAQVGPPRRTSSFWPVITADSVKCTWLQVSK